MSCIEGVGNSKKNTYSPGGFENQALSYDTAITSPTRRLSSLEEGWREAGTAIGSEVMTGLGGEPIHWALIKRVSQQLNQRIAEEVRITEAGSPEERERLFTDDMGVFRQTLQEFDGKKRFKMEHFQEAAFGVASVPVLSATYGPYVTLGAINIPNTIRSAVSEKNPSKALMYASATILDFSPAGLALYLSLTRGVSGGAAGLTFSGVAGLALGILTNTTFLECYNRIAYRILRNISLGRTFEMLGKDSAIAEKYHAGVWEVIEQLAETHHATPAGYMGIMIDALHAYVNKDAREQVYDNHKSPTVREKLKGVGEMIPDTVRKVSRDAYNRTIGSIPDSFKRNAHLQVMSAEEARNILLVIAQEL